MQVARFGEYDLIDSKKSVETNDRKADAAGDLLAVYQNKCHVLFLATDADSFERSRRDPSMFAPRIHQKFRYDKRASPVSWILDLTFRVKGPHVEIIPLLVKKL